MFLAMTFCAVGFAVCTVGYGAGIIVFLVALPAAQRAVNKARVLQAQGETVSVWRKAGIFGTYYLILSMAFAVVGLATVTIYTGIVASLVRF